ncbi:MAG TPA: histidine phosphatase family protein [Acidimicrobiales bacterium]|nr:histidine phosphatase family protein [Acidimicrobiales bacterium]
MPTPPKPTTVLLVRHGRTPTTGSVLPGRRPGLHLSEEGRGQAERAAERIAALQQAPAAVYASPLERTRETAAPIAKALGLRVRTDQGLLEADMGRWTGGSLKRLGRTRDWGRVQRWPAGFRFPGGESFAEMATRATDAVLRLVAAHPGKTVVAVSHADPIKAVVAGAAGVPLDLFQRLVVSPCSVTAILYGPGGPHVLCVNAVDSLTSLELS